LAPQRPQLLVVQPRDVLAAEADPALVGVDHPHHGLGGGRLAAPGLADEREHLAGSDREVDALDGVHVQLLAAPEGAQEAALDRVAGDQPLNVEQRDVRRRRSGRGLGGAHPATCAGTSFRWQAAVWLSPTSRRRGSSCGQRAKAESQRGWNGQPTTSRSSRGGAPGIEVTSSSPCRSGVAWNSIRVYGWRGSWKSVSIGPDSATLPAYITAARRHTWATTGRSWVTRIMASPRSSVRRTSSSRIWACTMTSSAVVGSSARSTLGLHASAIAIAARWRMPPENSCG